MSNFICPVCSGGFDKFAKHIKDSSDCCPWCGKKSDPKVITQ